MSFAAFELSIFGGKPIELYRFVHGSQVWTFCNKANVTYNSENYVKAAIKREAIAQDNEVARDTLKVSVSIDNEIARLFLLGSQEWPVGLTIYKYHQDDIVGTEFQCIWKGSVVMPVCNENRCELSCESLFSKHKLAGMRPRYTKHCRVELYGDECGVDKSAYAVSATVTGIDTALTGITFSAGSTFSIGYFVGGVLITPDGVARTIVKHSGLLVTLAGSIPDLAVNDVVTLYPGCDHSRTHCNDRFGNVANYRGFPWIPETNPFVTSII